MFYVIYIYEHYMSISHIHIYGYGRLYFGMKVHRSKEIKFQQGQIIGWHQCGQSNIEIARFFQVNHQTVNNIVKKFNEEGHCHMEQCSGRPSIIYE